MIAWNRGEGYDTFVDSPKYTSYRITYTIVGITGIKYPSDMADKINRAGEKGIEQDYEKGEKRRRKERKTRAIARHWERNGIDDVAPSNWRLTENETRRRWGDSAVLVVAVSLVISKSFFATKHRCDRDDDGDDNDDNESWRANSIRQ